MDNYRNKILNLNLNLSIAQVSLAFGTFLTGAFGMNLLSGLETIPYVFYLVGGIAYALRLTFSCRVGSCGMMYSFFQLRNRTMKQSPLKREKAATYLSGLFRGIDNFDVALLSFMCPRQFSWTICVTRFRQNKTLFEWAIFLKFPALFWRGNSQLRKRSN